MKKCNHILGLYDNLLFFRLSDLSFLKCHDDFCNLKAYRHHSFNYCPLCGKKISYYQRRVYYLFTSTFELSKGVKKC